VAIFSRRSLQRMLQYSATYVPEPRRQAYVRALNKGEPSSLSVEWELALLWGFGHVAQLAHEPENSGPDLVIRTSESDPPVLVADVTAVSDRGIKDANPHEESEHQLKLEIKRHKLRAGRFTYEISSETRGSYQERTVVLRLPPKGELPQVFKKEIRPFFKEIQQRPDEKHVYAAPPRLGEFWITYNPSQQYFRGGYTVYRKPKSLTRNPVFNALKTKAKKLRDSGFDTTKGVFMCDGGCKLLSESSDYERIADELFRDYSTVDFIAVLTIQRRHSDRARDRIYCVLSSILTNEDGAHPLTDDSRKIIESAIARIPSADWPPESAIHWLRYMPKHRGRSHHPGARGQWCKVTFSARVLLEVLTGERDCESFLNDTYFKNPPDMPRPTHPLEGCFAAGYTLSAIKLERTPEHDDDWITLELKPDPALMQFGLSWPTDKFQGLHRSA